MKYQHVDTHNYIFISEYGGFLTWDYPQIIQVIRQFQYISALKAMVLGMILGTPPYHHISPTPTAALLSTCWSRWSKTSMPTTKMEVAIFHRKSSRRSSGAVFFFQGRSFHLFCGDPILNQMWVVTTAKWWCFYMFLCVKQLKNYQSQWYGQSEYFFSFITSIIIDLSRLDNDIPYQS